MSENLSNSGSYRSRSLVRGGRSEGEYNRLDQSDSERTRDEYLEAIERDREIKEDYNKSNLFKSRIIVTRVILLICWVPIEFYRLDFGFKANIKESVNDLFIKLLKNLKFPDVLFFSVSTFVFVVPVQVMQITGGRALPFDYAITLIELIFVIVELIYCGISSANITRKTGNTFYLRNTFTRVSSKGETVKSSNEIEQELFHHFPNLTNFKAQNNNLTNSKYN